MVRMRRFLPLFALAFATGCFTRYHKANELAESGKFIEAAALFEQLSAEHPQDKELRELLGRARYRAVQQALGRARQARLTGDPKTSQAFFAKGLELRSQWALKLDGALESTVEDEREDAVRRLRGLVAPHTLKGEALSAETIVESHAFLLRFPELSGLRQELSTATRAAGRATCQKLQQTAKASDAASDARAQEASPYLLNLVARYCQHFDERGPTAPPLPDALGSFEVSVELDKVGQGTSAELQAALDRVVRQSPWYSDGALRQGMLTARGSARLERSERLVMLSAPWEERVPYTEEVVKQLEESVPVTECQAYDEYDPKAPGGNVSRTREVTRQKTKTREVVVKETRHRDVPRSFDYQALRVEREGRFSSQAELTVKGEVLAAAGQEFSHTWSGYQHDVTFEPANVRPQRPAVAAFEEWTRDNGHALAGRLSTALAESYQARFCTTAAPSKEEAARCARGGKVGPGPTADALVPLLGTDAYEAPRILGPLKAVPVKTGAR